MLQSPEGLVLHVDLPEIFETGHVTWEDGTADYARLATDWITKGYREV
jgi:hypothetical protein